MASLPAKTVEKLVKQIIKVDPNNYDTYMLFIKATISGDMKVTGDQSYTGTFQDSFSVSFDSRVQWCGVSSRHKYHSAVRCL